MPPASPALPRNTSSIGEGAMLGPYRLLSLLGEGSGGRVFRAVHTKLDRQVAVKVLRSEHASKRNLVRRFFQEARVANQIQHENIVEITDLVAEERGSCYIIMELLRGESLELVLERDRLISIERALEIARQVCSAMAAAHRAGIIHRDLKPGNVFLCERSETRDFVKLLDFGVAKIAFFRHDESEGAANDAVGADRTQVGTLLGTPEYMSPEQADGKAVDHRADIYSFGVMLYEMVTGRRPFHGETLQGTLDNQRKKNPPRPSSLPDLPHRIPPRFESLILSCLAKQPERRPQSMDRIAEELALIRSEVKQRSIGRALPLIAAMVLFTVVAGVSAWLALRDLSNGPVHSTIRLKFESNPARAAVVRSSTK
jgi:serine/threonine-protein kinase